MAILAFQKPDEVSKTVISESQAAFDFKPLETTYGITIGNALRRILLSSLEGYAIASIRIDGVNHEFATIPGVMEDVTNIILNLKKVRFKRIEPTANEETVSLTLSGKTEFLAGDFNQVLSSFEVQNADQLICHMDSDVNLTIHIRINSGRGYVPAVDNKRDEDLVDTIAVDSIYTPIRNVKFDVENFRVGQKTDYERLILDVTTDGTITPEDALKDAARILIEHFSLLTHKELNIAEDEPEFDPMDELHEAEHEDNKLYASKLNDFDLSVRALNCLNSAGIDTLADLMEYSMDELLKVRNFGKKSSEEVLSLLEELKIELRRDDSAE